MIGQMEKPAAGRALTDEDGTPLLGDQDPKFVAERAQQFRLDHGDRQYAERRQDRRIQNRFTRRSGRKSSRHWTNVIEC